MYLDLAGGRCSNAAQRENLLSRRCARPRRRHAGAQRGSGTRRIPTLFPLMCESSTNPHGPMIAIRRAGATRLPSKKLRNF